jgi:hypothetical protein
MVVLSVAATSSISVYVSTQDSPSMKAAPTIQQAIPPGALALINNRIYQQNYYFSKIDALHPR